MAHFAQLDHNNIVINIIRVNNEDMLDSNGQEQESVGIDYLKMLFGQNTKWVQTSYNSNFRKLYAGINFIYSERYDHFMPPKPYPSWILNEEQGIWNAPVDYPMNGKNYDWDEQQQVWIEVPESQDPIFDN